MAISPELTGNAQGAADNSLTWLAIGRILERVNRVVGKDQGGGQQVDAGGTTLVCEVRRY
jgi:hypothetical protein